MSTTEVPSQMRTADVVAATDLTKVYGEGESEVRALDGVTIGFPHGQLAAVMGPSGSGKSTLMHILAGLDQPTSGSVVVDGTELAGLNDQKLTLLRREKIGFVFQFFNLLPMLTARENIELPMRIAGASPDPAWQETLIDAIGLGDRLSHRPSELSGGQQQRVAVARALLSRPAVVFGDEPTGNLDSKTGAEVLQLLRRAVDEFGQTVIMVTHDASAASIADRVVFLRDGKVVRDSGRMSASEILDTIKTLE
ncbi:MAG: ABC transporter ATP-binding protein [Gaiellales bacterium]|jgi:putative ABC transport system ATP-binding protein